MASQNFSRWRFANYEIFVWFDICKYIPIVETKLSIMNELAHNPSDALCVFKLLAYDFDKDSHRNSNHHASYSP